MTLSARQAQFARQRIHDAGLAARAEIRLADYRDVADGPYDAVSVIEMGEHVGKRAYPAFAARLAALLRPGARLLVQQMSRTVNPDGGPFIASYIAPDMHMRPLPQTLALIQSAGLEILGAQAMREHYARTFLAWRERLERNHQAASALVGEEATRVWPLFLAGGGLAFELRTTGVDQVVATSAAGAGRAPLALGHSAGR